jgi:hypothetical protein
MKDSNQAKSVFTVFAFGTGESSKMKKHNIITKFSLACKSENFVLEGPGLLGLEVEGNVKKAVGGIIDWLEKSPDHNNINLTGFSRGAVTCTRIAYCVHMLANDLEAARKKYPELLERIEKNPELVDRLKKVKFNIFAMDPVAGMANKADEDARVIPPNVVNYVATLQKDELRIDFDSQDKSRAIVTSTLESITAGGMRADSQESISKDSKTADSTNYDSEKTKVTFLPFPGNHSDGTKVKSDKMKDLTELYWLSMYNFLQQNGTDFEGNIPDLAYTSNKVEKNYNQSERLTSLEPKAILKTFAQMHKQNIAYERSGKKIKLGDGLPTARKKRGFTEDLESYVLDSDIFMNQLEREAMKMAYPEVFGYLFQGNVDDNGIKYTPNDDRKAKVIEELKELREENPLLFKRLVKSGRGVEEEKIGSVFTRIFGPKSKEPGEIKLGEPCGYNRVERCDLMKQFGSGVADDTKYQPKLYERLSDKLQNQLNQVTYQYQIENLQNVVFLNRRQHDVATKIRNLVREAQRNNHPLDMSYNQVIRTLCLEYQKLVESNNSSKLAKGLKAVLEDHGVKIDLKVSKVAPIFKGFRNSMRGVAYVIKFAGDPLGAVGSAIFNVGNAMRQDTAEIEEGPRKNVAEITNKIGSVIEKTGIFVGNVVPAIGQGITDFGNRADDWAKSQKMPLPLARIVTFPLKAACNVAGAAVKEVFGISFITRKVSDAIKEAADFFTKSTGVIKVKAEVSEVHKENLKQEHLLELQHSQEPESTKQQEPKSPSAPEIALKEQRATNKNNLDNTKKPSTTVTSPSLGGISHGISQA